VFEEIVLREFRRRYHHYSKDVPDAKDDLEWLALMQHHGAPTRLLDWTYSIYVAAYFALEDAEGDCAVWAMDAENWLIPRAAELFVAAGKDGSYVGGLIQEEMASAFRGIFMDAPLVKVVAPVNAFRLNERLTIQKGLFLSPGDVSVSLMENLERMGDWGAHAEIHVIPERLRREAIAKLFLMNVHRATLFPGLDGFAQSLGVHHHLFQRVVNGEPIDPWRTRKSGPEVGSDGAERLAGP